MLLPEKAPYPSGLAPTAGVAASPGPGANPRIGGYNHDKREDDHDYDIVKLSPDYTAKDVEAFGPAIDYSFERLWPQFMRWSVQDVSELQCPIVLFHGVHDLTTSAKLAEQWHAQLCAPEKTSAPPTGS